MLRTNNNNNNNNDDDDDNHHHRSLRRGALLGLGFWGLAECAARADQVQVLESRRQRLQDAVQPGGVHGSVLRSRGRARLYDSLRVGRRPLRPPLTYWWQDLVAAVQHTHAAHNTQHTTHKHQQHTNTPTTETPIGAVRFTLQEPTKFPCDPTDFDNSCELDLTPKNDLPYCSENPDSSRKFQKYNCTYLSSEDALHVYDQSVMLTTRFKTATWKSACPAEANSCTRLWNTTQGSNM